MASPFASKLHSLATMQAFLDNHLDAETQAAVERLLAENPDYAAAMEALDRYQTEDPELRQTHQQDFKEYINTLADNKVAEEVGSFEEPLVRDLRSARWWQIAAVILILALPLAYVFLRPQPGMDQLAMDYLEPYTFSGTRSASATKTLLDSALQLYELARNQYIENPPAYRDTAPAGLEEAKAAFLLVLEHPADSLGVQAYLEANMGLGMCLLFQGYPEEAIRQFEPIIQQGDNIWLPAANWYKAWGLLLLERKDEAITVLSDLSRHKSDYRLKAQNLLDELL